MSAHTASDALHIRNFSIIAHIDHGKIDSRRPPPGMHRDRFSTAGKVRNCSTPWNWSEKGGITIKARAVSHGLTGRDGQLYELNLSTLQVTLISYEVSPCARGREGALFVWTPPRVSKPKPWPMFFSLSKQDLAIVAVINKIDLPKRGSRKGRGRGQPVHRVAQRRDCLRLRQNWEWDRRGPRGRRQPICLLPSGVQAAPTAQVFHSHFDPYKGRYRLRQGRRRLPGSQSGDSDPPYVDGKEAGVAEPGLFRPELRPATGPPPARLATSPPAEGGAGRPSRRHDHRRCESASESSSWIRRSHRWFLPGCTR